MLGSALFQDPGTAPQPIGAAAEPTASSWLWDLARSPGFLETVVALVVFAALVLAWWRLSRLSERIKSRALLRDWFLGVEQALHGDSEGAEARLLRVLQADPENHYARLLLGNVHLQRGHPEKAHAEHLLLRDSFAIRGGENGMQLAKALLAAGQPAEAAAAAAEVAKDRPQDAEAQELWFRCLMQQGDFQAAVEVGERLVLRASASRHGTRVSNDAARQRIASLRNDVAHACCQAGAQQLWRGDRARAQALLRKAELLAAELPAVPLLAARIDAIERGEARVVEALLQAGVPVVAVGSAASNLATTTPAPTAQGPWLPRIAPLLPTHRFCCSRCNAPLPSGQGACATCLAEGAARIQEPDLFVAVPAPDRLADALEANEAHIRRVCREATDDGDAHSVEAARHAVLELGARAVPQLLSRATGRGAAADRAMELLRLLGPETTPALLAAAEQMESDRLLPDGGMLTNTVGRVVQGFDRGALPYVRSLLSSAQRSQRKILIDYFLGLADMDEFQVVLERFPPIEILHRLGKAEDAALRRFLQAAKPNSFVLDVLLAEPMFERDVDVLRAIDGAQHPRALEALLARRGPSPALMSALLEALAQEPAHGPAFRILASFGQRALEPLLSALGDPDREMTARSRIAELLVAVGPSAVDRICQNFGAEPSELDDSLRSVLVRMGDAAVDPMAAAYARPGWIERMTIGLVTTGAHRRRQIARALCESGTRHAEAALSRLRASEQDAGLALQLDEVLHRLRVNHPEGPR
jgi:tetratricopeptide (TPR) repeat protein